VSDFERSEEMGRKGREKVELLLAASHFGTNFFMTTD
jgi:hypothetical protein